MRILFDANVMVSAIVTRGLSFDVIKDSVYKHEVFYTDYLLGEIKEILAGKFFLSEKIAENAVRLLKKYFIKGKTSRTVDKICRDPGDDQVLADAAANKIEILISADKDLSVLKKYKGIKIILPRDYWKL
ncbi:MAG: putative toxin-antitoxin system toxin component, PIN family [Elusimicrobia bacterium CG08_land_8_20_14_0_20_44_26]|nr:MAG: putative toxin-antitoxin system toxin component, PIN family [Elusimicrobia bacterium CG08_land_8_20_14_0_20_44_26]